MRTLVLMHGAVPIALDTFAGSLRSIILDYPDDDVDLWSVWQVPPIGSLAPSVEITEQFAKTWAIECEFASGIEPDQYLSGMPAFVVHHARGELIRIWQRRMAARDQSFIPDPTRSVAA